MNERIKQLVKQATEDVFRNTPSFLVTNEMWQEKFAELIVRECMKVAQQQRNPANLNYKPSERFVEDLRQHFGVEE